MNRKANEHRQQTTALNKLTGKEHPGRRALEQQGLGREAVSAVLSHGQNFEAILQVMNSPRRAQKSSTQKPAARGNISNQVAFGKLPQSQRQIKSFCSHCQVRTAGTIRSKQVRRCKHTQAFKKILRCTEICKKFQNHKKAQPLKILIDGAKMAKSLGIQKSFLKPHCL